MMRVCWTPELALGLALVLGQANRVAGQEPLELTRVMGPIEIDGRPEEPAWQRIVPLPLTTYLPVFGQPPTQRTEIRVAYDDANLYFAGWFHDDDPGGIRINSLYRDRWNGDDAFAIYVDAFNDDQNAKWFGTTPGGIRFDVLVSDDGRTLNQSWDTFWQARTTVTDGGWFAEVRIPFSSLGFRVDDDGRAVMGLTVTRLVSRTGERVTFPAIDPKFEFRAPSQAHDVVLHDVRSHTPLYVTPYVLTGRDRVTVGDPVNGFRSDAETSREAGLDVRYPVSAQLTLDVTANTDFAQVEADEQQVALDRFPLFYPERRRFFQEGSGVFDMQTGGGSLVFHSRRIGLTPDLQPVPVLAGARLVGRVGAWDVGLLDMQTQEQGGAPGENFGVLRLRRQVLNPSSTAGFMATSRVSSDRHNVVLAADARLRLWGDDYLAVKWAGSIDERDAGGTSLVDRSHFFADLERRTLRGLMYRLSLIRSGEDYRPELGFLQRRDFTTANLISEYYFFTDRHPWLRRIWPGALAFSTFRNADGELESGTYAFWVQWQTKTGGGGWLEPKWFHENVAARFTIGGEIDIPAGVYDFADFQVALHMNQGARIRTAVDARAGSYFDGRRAQIILTPTWNVSPHLEIGGDYQLTALRFPVRGQAANIHVGRLRVRTALDARFSGNGIVQYNSTTDALDVNVRLRYAIAEGTDLWLVYNEGLDTQRDHDLGVRSPLSTSRAVILKYSHTLAF